MVVLNKSDREKVKADVQTIIEASGEKAKILRPVYIGRDTFAGKRKKEIHDIGEFPIEVVHLSAEDIQITGHDLFMHFLPDVDIREGDIVDHHVINYRVTDIVPHNFFGTLTHQEAHLKRDEREGGGERE